MHGNKTTATQQINLSSRPDLTPLQQKGRRELVAKLWEKKASVVDLEDWGVVHKPLQPKQNH